LANGVSQLFLCPRSEEVDREREREETGTENEDQLPLEKESNLLSEVL